MLLMVEIVCKVCSILKYKCLKFVYFYNYLDLGMILKINYNVCRDSFIDNFFRICIVCDKLKIFIIRYICKYM